MPNLGPQSITLAKAGQTLLFTILSAKNKTRKKKKKPAELRLKADHQIDALLFQSIFNTHLTSILFFFRVSPFFFFFIECAANDGTKWHMR